MLKKKKTAEKLRKMKNELEKNNIRHSKTVGFACHRINNLLRIIAIIIEIFSYTVIKISLAWNTVS